MDMGMLRTTRAREERATAARAARNAASELQPSDLTRNGDRPRAPPLACPRRAASGSCPVASQCCRGWPRST
eukprot:15446264-Alexandrium_andersonii.AAC.1